MSEDFTTNERAPRVPRSFAVRISEDISTENVHWDMVTAKNLSASGILFNYDRYIEPGTRIRFKISLPVCDAVECEGEVVRNVMGPPRGVFAGSDPEVCAIAAVFKDISEHDQLVMGEFLSACDEVEVNKFPADDKPSKPREKRIDRSFFTWIQRIGQTDWVSASMKNLSVSGALIGYSEPLDIEEQVALRIRLPFLESPVVCRGQVVRVDKVTAPGALMQSFYIGIKFSSFDEAAQQQFGKYVEKHGRD
ncbi:MAG: PilZ domain-containing protein [Kiritimatiellales bacterium]|nr:PilZ domain-containing protein [Kiritimatiellota bacterium]MBL7011318.1 PilZ domain-containing protein [Kiritimatiellales bacterium]